MATTPHKIGLWALARNAAGKATGGDTLTFDLLLLKQGVFMEEKIFLKSGRSPQHLGHPII